MFKKPDGSVWVAPPKCGTNTLYAMRGRKLGKGWHPRDPNLLKDAKEVVLVVRDPVERLLSMWRSCTRKRLAQSRKKYCYAGYYFDGSSSDALSTWVQVNCDHPAGIVQRYKHEQGMGMNPWWFAPQEWWMRMVQPDRIVDISELGQARLNNTDEIDEWREPDERVILAAKDWDHTFYQRYHQQ